MLQKKVCMIGDFSVGKTSLVNRFVRQTFSEKYLRTVGVKIDTKVVILPDNTSMKLVLWDIAESNALTTTTTTYLRGAAGFFLIVDGTRLSTWQSALHFHRVVINEIGEKPFITLLNKADLQKEWEIDESMLEAQKASGWSHFLYTSAKTNLGVEDAFLQLSLLLG